MTVQAHKIILEGKDDGPYFFVRLGNDCGERLAEIFLEEIKFAGMMWHSIRNQELWGCKDNSEGSEFHKIGDLVRISSTKGETSLYNGAVSKY